MCKRLNKVVGEVPRSLAGKEMLRGASIFRLPEARFGCHVDLAPCRRGSLPRPIMLLHHNFSVWLKLSESSEACSVDAAENGFDVVALPLIRG